MQYIGIVTVRGSSEISSLPDEHEEGAELEEVLSTFQTEERDEKAVEERLAAVLLKLENVLHVPSSVVDELLQDLHFLMSSASLPALHAIVSDFCTKHNLGLNETEIVELASAACVSNPLTKSIGDQGPLSTAFKRKKYFKDKFQVVEPVEYVLNKDSKHTYQYISFLQSLQQLLSKDGIVDYVLANCSAHSNETAEEYKSFQDGEFFKQKSVPI